MGRCEDEKVKGQRWKDKGEREKIKGKGEKVGKTEAITQEIKKMREEGWRKIKRDGWMIRMNNVMGKDKGERLKAEAKVKREGIEGGKSGGWEGGHI